MTDLDALFPPRLCPQCGAEMVEEMDEDSGGNIRGDGHWDCPNCGNDYDDDD